MQQTIPNYGDLIANKTR